MSLVSSYWKGQVGVVWQGRKQKSTEGKLSPAACMAGDRRGKKTTSGMLLGLIKGAVLHKADANLLDWQPGGEDHIARSQAEQVKRGSEMGREKTEAPQQTRSKRLLFLLEGTGCATTGGRAGLHADVPHGTGTYSSCCRFHLIPDSLVIHRWRMMENRPLVWLTHAKSKAHQTPGEIPTGFSGISVRFLYFKSVCGHQWSE